MADYSVILSDGTRETELVGGPDGVYLTEFSPPLIARDNVYAQGADAEGRRRVRSTPTNPEGSFRVRVDWSESDEVDLYDDLHDFQDLVESAHRNKGWLKMTPIDGEAVTFDFESIRISDFPHDVSLIADRRTELTVEFECAPYGRLDPVTVFSGEVISGPSDSVEIDLSNITSHTDLYGELTLTDTSTQDADHVEIGLEHTEYDPDDPQDFLIDSDDLLTTGYSGTGTTRTGAYDPNAAGNNVIRATLTTTPTQICAWSGTHLGRHKIRARVYPSADTVLVRLAWRIQDGPYIREEWVAVPGSANFYDLALGVIDIPDSFAGTAVSGHYWIGYIEAKSSSGIPTVDVDFVEIIPAEVYGRAAGAETVGVSTGGLVAADDFDSHTAGALSTKTPPLVPAGSWSESGDADDFTINTTYACVNRTAVSDADLNTGQYIRCGSGVATYTTVQLDVYVNGTGAYSAGNLRQGVFARYVDVNNWLMAVYEPQVWVTSYITLYKRVAGTVTQLSRMTLPGGVVNTWRTLQLIVDSAGGVAVLDGPQGGTLTGRLLILGDTDLDSGAIDDGGYGMYDAYTSATALTRWYNNFSVTTPASTTPLTNHALNSGQSMKFLHNSCVREDSSSLGYGRVPIFSGQHLRIPAATLNRQKSRLIVKRRRQSSDAGYPDAGLTDAMTADLSVTPRVLITGG